MFDLQVLQWSAKIRTGPTPWLAESVATAGLLLVILRAPEGRAPSLVASYIRAAYWFTASTSFANPAAAFGRMFSDTFAGIAPTSTPGFMAAQIFGAMAGLALHRALGQPNPGHPNVLNRPGQMALLLPSHRRPDLAISHAIIMSKPSVTIYHNPACGTSRNTLALIRNSGVEPEVIEYLKTPPSRETLQVLLAAMGMPVRGLLRQKKGTPYEELGLNDAKWSDEELLDHIVAHPVLMNRPVVVTPLGAKLCRPSEEVLDILPGRQQASFKKEDGELVIDAEGQRVAKPA